MIRRIRIVPTEPMARVLADYDPEDRATPEAAALILLRDGYLPDDIATGLDDAMALASDLGAIAVSERPAAVISNLVGTLAACAAVIAFVGLVGLPV